MEPEFRLVALDGVAVSVAQSRTAPDSRAIRYFLILFIGLGAVLLLLLSIASANTALFARQYPLLLALGGGLVLCLMSLVGYQLWMLRRKLKARVFGSKLSLRLTLVFALMALVPGALIYGVSVQFLEKGIESWFDVRVDKALESGLGLGRTILDSMLRDLGKKAETMALALSELPASDHMSALNRLREQTGVQEATLVNQRGAVVAFSGTEHGGLAPYLPGASVLRQIRLQQNYRAIEAIPEKGLYLRVVAPVNALSLNEGVLALQLMQPVPKDLAQDAEAVQAVYRDYQELSLSRLGLKRLYGLTLTLSLLLALFSALALGVLLSERLSSPLEVLEEGTRAVAQGDFTQRQPVYSRDELGLLTRSFNMMTRQLAEARAAAQQNQAQLETANAYLESILANLSAGVISFDESFRLRAANPSAQQILGADFTRLRRLPLAQWGTQDARLSGFAEQVLEAFRHAAGGEWEKQVEYPGKSGTQVLLVRGTVLPAGAEAGQVMVFDDITHLLQAQRDAAWGEVARRLAHEIKNPLTPIRLSAERMQHKLADKLDSQDAEVLSRSTQTIVNQVAALKSMVDAFSQYARTPEPSMQILDLNLLVREVLTLYESLSGVIRLELTAPLPSIMGDTAQLRQVIHNLLQNAQDALAETENPAIVVRTASVGDSAVLSISDNGSGIPDQLMPRLFEPYVTTKQKGTGLGLAIVKKIVEEHGGRIHIENVSPHGVCASMELPLAAASGAEKETEKNA